MNELSLVHDARVCHRCPTALGLFGEGSLAKTISWAGRYHKETPPQLTYMSVTGETKLFNLKVLQVSFT